jgi:hypothetical protein
MDDIPDINANPEQYDLIDWEMEPGDILMFHPLTLHGSFGNASRVRRRRALALRWIGDDVVYAPHSKRMPIHYQHDSIEGSSLRGAAFPRILPFPDPTEREARRHVEYPQFEQLAHSAINNTLAAARLHLKGKSIDQLKQTWTK